MESAFLLGIPKWGRLPVDLTTVSKLGRAAKPLGRYTSADYALCTSTAVQQKEGLRCMAEPFYRQRSVGLYGC